jgi:hypothetical protein
MKCVDMMVISSADFARLNSLRKDFARSRKATPRGLKSLRENSAYEPISRQGSENQVPYTKLFCLAGVEKREVAHREPLSHSSQSAA